MHLLDHLGAGDIQQIIQSFEILLPILESLSSKRRLIQLISLDHRPHRPINEDNALAQQRVQLLDSVVRIHCSLSCNIPRLYCIVIVKSTYPDKMI